MPELTALLDKYVSQQRLEPEEHRQLSSWLTSLELPAGGDLARLFRDFEAVKARSDSMFQGNNTIEELSQLTDNLGLQMAGEFRVGNGIEPGAGFTGGRFGWPGFVYGTATYFLAGVVSDVLQIGLSLADGKLYAGGGDVVIDASGITIVGDASNRIVWKSGSTVLADMYSQGGATHHGVATRAFGAGAADGYIAWVAYDDNTESYFTTLDLQSDTGLTLRMTNTSSKVANTRGFVIQDEISSNTFSTILYLDMFKTSGSTTPFGVAVSLRGMNSTQTLKDMSYFGARYTTATNTVEDVEFPISVLVGGTAKEVVVIDKSGIYMDANKGGVRTTAFSLNADTATSFTPSRTIGLIIVGTGGTGNGGICAYNTGGAGSCVVTVGGANLAATNVQLTGTTGTAGKLTVSAYATDGKIYVENRTAATRAIQVLLI